MAATQAAQDDVDAQLRASYQTRADALAQALDDTLLLSGQRDVGVARAGVSAAPSAAASTTASAAATATPAHAPPADAINDGSTDSDTESAAEPDVLYDKDADDADSAWVEVNMRRGQGRSGLVMRPTAALLSCPSCFSMVCVDCEEAKGSEDAIMRWRAAAACDCEVAQAPASHADACPSSGSRASCAQNDVQCGYCGTVVGTFDAVRSSFLFHNVIPSL